MEFVISIAHYLWVVFGNVWGILLLLTGALDLWERFFDRKTRIPAWLRAAIFVAVVFVAQAVAYKQLADIPPTVLDVKAPPAPIVQLPAVSKVVASPLTPQPKTQQTQSGHDNVQSGPITQGPCSSVQQGGAGNQANINCGSVRSLTADEKTQLIQNLRQTPGTVTVYAVETGQSLGEDIYDALHAAGWQMQEPEVQMMLETKPHREDIAIFVHGEPGDTGTFSTSDPSTVNLVHSIDALKRFKWGLARSEKVPKGVIKIAIEPPVT